MQGRKFGIIGLLICVLVAAVCVYIIATGAYKGWEVGFTLGAVTMACSHFILMLDSFSRSEDTQKNR